jgi:molecular chaperone HscB
MTDAFDTLGVGPTFALDLPAVERLHRELSRTLHPDRHVGKSAGERRVVLNKAIEVNEAWRTLRDPVKRAEALLQRLGVAVGETNEPAVDPMLLMEMMEQREALADARRAKDAMSLTKLASSMRRRDLEVVEELSEAFAKLAENDTPSTREAALRKLGELRYVARFLEEVGEIEDELL